MITRTINNFIGGIDDPRSTINGACTSSRHFMLGRTKLSPYRDTETESLSSGTLTQQKLTDAVAVSYSATKINIFALGNQSNVNAYPKIYQKATDSNLPDIGLTTIQADFSATANGEGSDGVVIPGSLFSYRGSADTVPNIYCLKTKSGSTYLMKHVYATSFTEIGVIGTSPINGLVPQPLIHPKDNKVYIASGYEVKTWDGSSLSSVVTFSKQHEITSITWQGNNIILGMVAKDKSGSVLGIWDGSTTVNTLIDLVEFGSDTLMLLDNLNDVVIGVSGLSVGGSSSITTKNNVVIRGYSGGTSIILKNIESMGTLGSRVYPFKAHRDSRIFFPMSTYLDGTRVHQIWSIYKNEQGIYIVSPDRKCNNDTELVSETITGFSMIGDYFWVAFSDGSFRRTNDQETFTATSQYITLVNPNMETTDRSKKKQLKAVSLRCGSPVGASHTVTLSVSADGGAYETIYSGSSSSKVRVIEQVKLANGKAFLDAREYMFKIETTGNGEIYELKYGYENLPTLI